MNILITGGCGFVGSRLAQQLHKRHTWNTTILDNLMTGENPNPDIRLIRGDIRDTYLMKNIVPQFDTIVHLAAIVGVPACSVDEQFAFDVNVIGTQNIARNLAQGARIIFASSTSAYGNKINELVTEETTLSPLTNYGLHKLYNETEIRNQTKSHIIVRPATAFGLSQRSRIDVLPNTLIYTALTQNAITLFEPDVIRPFIHVYDFARVLEYAIDGHMPFGIYNIGDPHLTMTKQQLAESIAQMSGVEIVSMSGSDPDKRNYNMSFDKLLVTGFEFNDMALRGAFIQIYEELDNIKAHYDEYNAPFHVKEYLRKYGNNCYI